MDDESYEAEICGIMVPKVVLPTGIILKDVIFNEDNSIREEKERILREANIPYPVLYVVVVHGPHGSYEVLDDARNVTDCLALLQEGIECEVHIQKKSSQVERPARSVKPELFNVQMK